MGKPYLVVLSLERTCSKCGRSIPEGFKAIKTTKRVSTFGKTYFTIAYQHENCWEKGKLR